MQDTMAVCYLVRSKAAVHRKRKLKLVPSKRKVEPVVRAPNKTTNGSSNSSSYQKLLFELG